MPFLEAAHRIHPDIHTRLWLRMALTVSETKDAAQRRDELFRFGEHLDKINPENNYDIAFNLEINEWQGYKKLQLRIVDLKQVD